MRSEPSRTSHIGSVAALLAAAVWTGAGVVRADLISSGDFDIGYGWSNQGSGNEWSKAETSAANTPTGLSNTFTLGSFSITITPSGTSWGGAGPKFIGRTLTDGTTIDFGSSTFTTLALSVSATYTGAVQAHHQLRLEIDELSMHGYIYSIGVPVSRDLYWSETTAGHTDQSAAATGLSYATGWWLAANYIPITWDPSEFLSTGVATQTRTFVLTKSTGATNDTAIDGLEISGRAVLLTPEPTSAMILTIAAALLVKPRRQRHHD